MVTTQATAFASTWKSAMSVGRVTYIIESSNAATISVSTKTATTATNPGADARIALSFGGLA
ncbi:hypothetical protein GCM10010038_05450 [Glutamicibacter protophormiae]|nr:hypothetical protein GCM10010038_05450 [Glutamicibacter protophormiae]